MNDKRNSDYLEDQFLIAMPQLQDSYFANTVTYLWKHNAEGALGFIINKPLRATATDLFNELGIVCNIDDGPFREQLVLTGGPVEADKGFIIHDAGDSWESSISVTPNISICTSKTILQDIAAGNGPKNYAIALGCAGWEAGQLEQEIGDNAWLTVPANSDLVYSRDHAKKIHQAAAILGIDMQQISPAAGHS